MMQANHTYLASLLMLLLASPLLAQQVQNYDSDVAEFVAMLDQQIQSGPQIEVVSNLSAQPIATDTEISLVNCDCGTSCDCGSSCNCGSRCCCPSWTGCVGYVYMWRERTGSDFNVLEDIISSNPIFTADQFDFDGQSGVDVSVGRDNGCGQGFEIRYLGVEEFVSDDNIPIAGGTFVSPATNPQSNNVPGGGNWDVHYESKFQSLELVGYRNLSTYKVSHGFRYVRLDESLQLLSSQNDDYRFAAENDLYGFQLGLTNMLWKNDRGWRVDTNAKAGVYLNQVDVASSASGLVTGSGRNDETNAAFLGELGVNAVYDVSYCLSLRAGYQVLFVDGVALAADEVPSTGRLTTGTTDVPVIVDSSSLFFHGLQVGLEYRR